MAKYFLFHYETGRAESPNGTGDPGRCGCILSISDTIFVHIVCMKSRARRAHSRQDSCLNVLCGVGIDRAASGGGPNERQTRAPHHPRSPAPARPLVVTKVESGTPVGKTDGGQGFGINGGRWIGPDPKGAGPGSSAFLNVNEQPGR